MKRGAVSALALAWLTMTGAPAAHAQDSAPSTKAPPQDTASVPTETPPPTLEELLPPEEMPATLRAELAAPPPPVDQLPEAVRELLLAAMRANDDAAVRAIARVTQATYPAAERELAGLLARWDDDSRVRAATLLALADVPIVIGAGRLRVDELDPVNPRIINGRGELGGFRSTGSTDEVGISLAVAVNYRIGRWTHKVAGSLNYRRSNGQTSQENIVFSYEPRLQWSPTMFFYGLGQYERAPFVGYDGRYTFSGGVGAILLQDRSKKLLATAGPAYRNVDYVLGDRESSLGFRSSLDFDWKLSPTARFTQTASGYAEDGVLTLNFDTGVTTKIATRLSTRFSYNIQVEQVGELGDLRYLRRFDTLSRVSLVYDF